MTTQCLGPEVAAELAAGQGCTNVDLAKGRKPMREQEAGIPETRALFLEPKEQCPVAAFELRGDSPKLPNHGLKPEAEGFPSSKSPDLILLCSPTHVPLSQMLTSWADDNGHQ